jgi:hypothetical protein
MNDWKKEFDERFRILVDVGFDELNQMAFNTYTCHEYHEQIKDFIESLLKKERENK